MSNEITYATTIKLNDGSDCIVTGPNREYYAKIILAAPYLLDAIQAHLEWLITSYDDADEDIKECERIEILMSEAIKKAT